MASATDQDRRWPYEEAMHAGPCKFVSSVENMHEAFLGSGSKAMASCLTNDQHCRCELLHETPLITRMEPNCHSGIRDEGWSQGEGKEEIGKWCVSS